MLTLSERQRRITSKHRSAAARQRWARERQREAQRRQEAQGRAVFDEALRGGALILERRNDKLGDRYYCECRQRGLPCVIITETHGGRTADLAVDLMSRRLTEDGIEQCQTCFDEFRRAVNCRGAASVGSVYIAMTAIPRKHVEALLRAVLAMPTIEELPNGVRKALNTITTDETGNTIEDAPPVWRCGWPYASTPATEGTVPH
jgi:hypothetical protein